MSAINCRSGFSRLPGCQASPIEKRCHLRAKQASKYRAATSCASASSCSVARGCSWNRALKSAGPSELRHQAAAVHHLHALLLHMLNSLILMERGGVAELRGVFDQVRLPTVLLAEHGRVYRAVLDAIVLAQAHKVHMLDLADTQEVRQGGLLRIDRPLGNA